MAKLLTEQFAFSGTVGDGDKSNIIENVPLCGATSANRRRYCKEAFAGERVARYNGRPVYLNHGPGRGGRSYQDQIGTVENARLNAEGLPVGDIAINPKKPYAEAVLWDAKHKPHACGMSHVAQCKTRTGADGWEEITEVVSVESVDLVTDPATTKGLRESKGSNVSKISVKQYVERFGAKWGAKPWAAATKLCEDLGGMADTPAIDEPAAGAEGGDLKSALVSAIAPMLDEAFESGDGSKVCSAIKDFIKLHAKHTGKGGGETETETDTEDDGYDKESKMKRPNPNAVLKECTDAGYSATPGELSILFEIADPAKRIVFIREQQAKVAEQKKEKPKSGGRNPGGGTSRTVAEQAGQNAPAKDVKEFMSRITR